jgi:5-formyltetrahydrofolate cyclo-ligase
MTKKELRKIYNEKRSQLAHSQKEKLDDLILIQFQRLQLPDATTLLSFWPMAGKNEIDSHLITDFILFQNPGLQIAYPVADFTTCTMQAILTNEDSEFKQNEYAILEPVSGKELDAKEIDIILIPLLAFDKHGYRIGYGKGFYDRYLENCREDILKIGFSYFEPEEKIDDIGSHDIKLDYCITPENIYGFAD